MWTSQGLNQRPPDYESGRTNKSSPRGEGFSERNVHTCRNQIPKSGPSYSEVPRLRSRLEIFLLTARPAG